MSEIMCEGTHQPLRRKYPGCLEHNHMAPDPPYDGAPRTCERASPPGNSFSHNMQDTGQKLLERALFFWYHHSAMGHFLSAQMTETKLIRKLAPKHFFMSKIEIRNSNLNVATTKTIKSRFHIQNEIFISKIESVYFFRVRPARAVPMH